MSAAQSSIGAKALAEIPKLIQRFEIMCRTEALRIGVEPVALIDLATLRLFARRIERTLAPPPRRTEERTPTAPTT